MDDLSLSQAEQAASFHRTDSPVDESPIAPAEPPPTLQSASSRQFAGLMEIDEEDSRNPAVRYTDNLAVFNQLFPPKGIKIKRMEKYGLSGAHITPTSTLGRNSGTLSVEENKAVEASGPNIRPLANRISQPMTVHNTARDEEKLAMVRCKKNCGRLPTSEEEALDDRQVSRPVHVEGVGPTATLHKHRRTTTNIHISTRGEQHDGDGQGGNVTTNSGIPNTVPVFIATRPKCRAYDEFIRERLVGYNRRCKGSPRSLNRRVARSHGQSRPDKISTKQCFFWRLPLELREMIYRHLLVAEKPIRIKKPWDELYACDRLKLTPGIVVACHRTVDEATRILISENTFEYNLQFLVEKKEDAEYQPLLDLTPGKHKRRLIDVKHMHLFRNISINYLRPLRYHRQNRSHGRRILPAIRSLKAIMDSATLDTLTLQLHRSIGGQLGEVWDGLRCRTLVMIVRPDYYPYPCFKRSIDLSCLTTNIWSSENGPEEESLDVRGTTLEGHARSTRQNLAILLQKTEDTLAHPLEAIAGGFWELSLPEDS